MSFPFILASALVAGAALAVWVLHVASAAAIEPEAFADLRFAKHLLAGHGHAWNVGEDPVFGSPSLLHVGVVTATLFVTAAADDVVLMLSSLLPAIAGVLLLIAAHVRFGRAGTPAGRALVAAAIIGLGMVLVDGGLLRHSTAGDATMVGFACHAALVYATAAAVRVGGGIVIAGLLVVAYACFLARPEYGVVATLVPGAAIALYGAPVRRRADLAAFVFGMGAVLIVDAVIKKVTLGDFVPLAYRAADPDRDGDGPVAALLAFLGTATPFLWLVFWTVDARGALRAAALAVPLLAGLGFSFMLDHAGGAGTRSGWPLLAFVVFASLHAFDRARLTGLGTVAREGLGLRVALTLLVALLPALRGPVMTWYDLRFPAPIERPEPRWNYDVRATRPLPRQSWAAGANFTAGVLEAAPPGTSLAASDFGPISARATDARLIDVLGRSDRELAAAGFSTDALFRREPDLIVLPRPERPALRAAILSDERFWAWYDFYPGAFTGLAVRRQGLRSAAVRKVFAAAWSRAFPGTDMVAHVAARID